MNPESIKQLESLYITSTDLKENCQIAGQLIADEIKRWLSTGQVPQHLWHPLGFIQLKLGRLGGHKYRLHLWEADHTPQPPSWPIHNHIFSFESLVLAGGVRNIVYRPSLTEVEHVSLQEGCYHEYRVEQDNGNALLVPTGLIRHYEVCSDDSYWAGEKYQLSAGEFHQSQNFTEHAVTLLRSKIEHKGHSLVLGAPNDHQVYQHQKSTLSRSQLLERLIDLQVQLDRHDQEHANDLGLG